MIRTALAISMVLFAGWTAGAQSIHNHTSVYVAPGFSTNPYLDPELRIWNDSLSNALVTTDARTVFELSSAAAYITVSGNYRSLAFPADGVSYDGIGIQATAQRQFLPGLILGAGGIYRSVSSGYRFHGAGALSFLSWQPFRGVRVSVRGGAFSQRVGRSEAFVTGASSFVDSEIILRPAGRWEISGTAGRGSSFQYDAMGSSVALAYLPSYNTRLSLRAGLEQLDQRSPDNAATLRQMMLRTSLHAEVPVAKWASVIAQAHLLKRLEEGTAGAPPESYFTLGFRLNFTTNLWRAPASDERTWREIDAGYRFEYQYRGDGRLFLVGEFNDWRLPGVELEPTGNNRFAAVLTLEPGIYEYKIRLERGDEEKWLPLPAGVRAVSDDFGGENGRLFVFP